MHYHFPTRWCVEGTCGEVADLLRDASALPRWWPSVYLHVTELDPPDAQGVGRRVRLLTKGWLPYTLSWESVVVESTYPSGFVIEATGDFVGRGVWRFVQDGPMVNITYHWSIRVEKPLVRRLTPLLRPLFEANHRWAMAQGEASLKLELARRRATSDNVRRTIPAPPGPVTFAAAGLVAGAVVAGATLAWLVARARRRRRR